MTDETEVRDRVIQHLLNDEVPWQDARGNWWWASGESSKSQSGWRFFSGMHDDERKVVLTILTEDSDDRHQGPAATAV